MSPPFIESEDPVRFSNYVDSERYKTEIPEPSTPRTSPQRPYQENRNPAFTKSRTHFEADSFNKEVPAHDFIDLVESPLLNRQHHLNMSPPSRSRFSDAPVQRCRTPPNLDPSDTSIPYFSSHTSRVNYNHQPKIVTSIDSPPMKNSIELYSSQDPLQMKKDLGGGNVRLSEEFEILSEPSFLVTNSPRIERDFPPDVCRNLDIISTKSDNSFEQNFHSINKTKNDNVEGKGSDLFKYKQKILYINSTSTNNNRAILFQIIVEILKSKRQQDILD